MVKVYAPTGNVGPHAAARAAAIPVLSGRRIGVLDNGKPNARALLERAAAQLAARTGATVAVVTGKGDGANAATPADTAVIDRLVKEVDLVLTGSAD